MGAQFFKPLSYNIRHKNNIFNGEQPYKNIENIIFPHYYSVIIMFIYKVFLTFIVKRLINSIHKTF